MSLRTEAGIAVEALELFQQQALDRSVPVISQSPMAELAGRLGIDRFLVEGGLRDDALRTFLRAYLDASTRLHHPRYMAHQVAVPESLAAVGALVDAFTNNAMAIYEMGPSAATVEFSVINWMLRKVGWRPSPLPGVVVAEEICGGGVLTHGGSLANLTALAAARARIAPNAWRNGAPGNLVIVAPAGSHYSIVRAAGILGLGADAVKAAPVDANGRFEPAKLEEFIDRLRNEGSQIMAVVANACATATGLYDPLRAIGKVCGDLAVWLHIDGAHGASALVSERHRHLLDGVEQADSLVWDAHKMLRTPTLCAAVLTRNRRDLDGAFQEEASYLFHEKDQPGFDFIHRTVECTKAALGLKVFCALAGDGERGIAAYVDRQTELARSAAAFLRDEPQIEVAVEPQSNIVCFRIDAEDEVQLEIRRHVTDTGTYYISTAEFRGKRWLRLALMNPATELSDIRKLVSEVRAIHANAKSERIAFPSVSPRP